MCGISWSSLATYSYEALELQPTVLLLLGDDQHSLEEQHLTRFVVLFHEQTLVPQLTQHTEICNKSEWVVNTLPHSVPGIFPSLSLPGPIQPSSMPDSSLTRLCCSCLRFTWSILCATCRIMAYASATSLTSQCLRRLCEIDNQWLLARSLTLQGNLRRAADDTWVYAALASADTSPVAGDVAAASAWRQAANLCASPAAAWSAAKWLPGSLCYRERERERNAGER